MDRIDSFVPYAVIAIVIAALAWLAVGKAAGKRADRPDGGRVFSLLSGAAYLTGAAFILSALAFFTH